MFVYIFVCFLSQKSSSSVGFIQQFLLLSHTARPLHFRCCRVIRWTSRKHTLDSTFFQSVNFPSPLGILCVASMSSSHKMLNILTLFSCHQCITVYNPDQCLFYFRWMCLYFNTRTWGLKVVVNPFGLNNIP